MPLEGCFGVIVVAIKLHIRIDPRLLPEGRHRPPDLQMRETFVLDDYKLLGLAEVGTVTFGVQSSSIVASATSLPRSSRYKVVINLPPCVSQYVPSRKSLKWITEP